VNIKFTHKVFGISPIYDWAYPKKLRSPIIDWRSEFFGIISVSSRKKPILSQKIENKILIIIILI
jgi:hypothetical protein